MKWHKHEDFAPCQVCCGYGFVNKVYVTNLRGNFIFRPSFDKKLCPGCDGEVLSVKSYLEWKDVSKDN